MQSEVPYNNNSQRYRRSMSNLGLSHNFGGYFDGPTRRIAYLVCALTTFAGCMTAVYNLYFGFTPYFYNDWEEKVREDYAKNHPDDKTTEKDESYVDVNSGQFYVKYTLYAIIALTLPVCAYYGLKEKNSNLFHLFSGCNCCCTFFSFLLGYGYVFSCDYAPGYCVPLQITNLLAFVAFSLSVYYSIKLMQETAIANDHQSMFYAQRFSNFPSVFRGNAQGNGSPSNGPNVQLPNTLFYAPYTFNSQPQPSTNFSTFGGVNNGYNLRAQERNGPVDQQQQAPQQTQQTFGSWYTNFGQDNLESSNNVNVANANNNATAAGDKNIEMSHINGARSRDDYNSEVPVADAVAVPLDDNGNEIIQRQSNSNNNVDNSYALDRV